jgi:hypothetical protein
LPQIRSTAQSPPGENGNSITPLRRRWIGNAEDYGRVG